MGIKTAEPAPRFRAWRYGSEAGAAVAMVDQVVTEQMARDEAVAQAKEEALARMAGSNAVSPDCEVLFINTLPYGGTEPIVTPVVRRPVDEHFVGLPA